MNLLETIPTAQAGTNIPALPHQVDWEFIQQQVENYGDVYINNYNYDSFTTNLTPAQQEENLLHVALWIVERDLKNFNMMMFHLDGKVVLSSQWLCTLSEPECGTRHCIAGFAQVMSGCKAFDFPTLLVGMLTLGSQNKRHFQIRSLNPEQENLRGLNFLKSVIASSCIQTKQGT
jgi:hypothetical protein